MSNEQPIKSVGGIAPFGYRWQGGSLIVDENESSVRKLIYELFIKHKRKKTVAKLLNDLGYRTRNDALFSDTTIDRLLRDTTAKGVRIVDGKEIRVAPIVSLGVWERANNFLNANSNHQRTKQPVQLFIGFAFCICGGKMFVPSNLDKYVCADCRHKILTDDLEEVFVSQLDGFLIPVDKIGENGKGEEINLADYWQYLNSKEKRIVIEQTLDKIIIGKTEIEIEFALKTHSLKTAAFGQQNKQGNETPKVETNQPNQIALNEPLMNEIEAAKFLGISRMTLLRKRNANEIGFFRVGFRVLYSKEKHLLPFLEKCEE
jgi:Recombinase